MPFLLPNQQRQSTEGEKRRQLNDKLMSCLATALLISRTILLFNTSLNKHGHSLGNFPNFEHFSTLPGKFETLDVNTR